MKQQASLAQAKTVKDWKARGQAVYNALTSTAKSSQASLAASLAARSVTFEKYWIVNAIKVTAEQSIIDELKARSDVAKIVPDHAYQVPPIRKSASSGVGVQTTEWGLDAIRAPEVWNQLGVFGDGIVVGSIDTGVEYTHPALVEQYRGSVGDGTFDHNYNWYDPANVCGVPSDTPCDNAAHGTHTMGTMVGDDHAGNQIGVAPHAKWMAAKGCESFNCSLTSLVAAGQWMLAPTDLNGLNPRPDLRPHVINNSWGGPGGDDFYLSVVESWVAAGIFPAFAAGNGFNSCGSVSSPGDYAPSFAVGAFDINGIIADFSLRGPSINGLIKPDIAAPGVFVRSSVPGGYDFFDGTSMATPHVAGTVALIWSASEALVRDIEGTRALLSTTAVDVNDTTCGGDAGDNNVWGEGKLDAFAAVDQAPKGPTGYLAGTVTNQLGEPIARASVAVTATGFARTTQSDPNGAYRLRLPVGSYDVAITAFGYLQNSQTGLVITQDLTTDLSPSLAPAPSFAVSGTVTDSDGGPLAGVRVTVDGTPIPATTTDAAGHYEFAQVPVGDYTVTANVFGCFEASSTALTVDADETLNFALNQRFDAFGYSCRPGTLDYVTATNPLPIFGDDSTTVLDLPFAFPFYGQAYSQISVNTNGFANFENAFPDWINTPIPEPFPPNTSIFPFWDDLLLVDGTVNYEFLGTAPNRQVVIEWRNIQIRDIAGTSLNFELVLSEGGDISMQYGDLGPSSAEHGGGATIGLENETGGIGLQYSFNQAVLETGTAIAYTAPPFAVVQGTVTDANTGAPFSGALVEAVTAGEPARTARTGADGTYRIAVAPGSVTLTISARNYESASATFTANDGDTITRNFSLKTGRASVTPANLQMLLEIGKTRTSRLTLSNTGSASFTFDVAESGGGRQTVVPTRTLTRNIAAKTSAANTRDLFAGGVQAKGLTPMAVGDVLTTFTPAIQTAWGLGFNGDLWVSEFFNLRNHEFLLDGTPTGRSWPTTSQGFAGDMAYDPSRNAMCQVDIDADNGIHCWDPDTGTQLDSITGSFPWTTTSQRGLAYRPDDDSFYIGGWFSGTIYHVAGLSSPNKGQVLGSCMPADGNISGLGWNGTANVLWVATNSMTDTIYELNPDDCTVISTLAHPQPGFNGAGLEVDTEGNLWMVSQGTNQVMLMDSGVPAASDVPWLSISPTTGTVTPGGTAALDATINTTGLTAGLYLANILVRTTAAKESLVRVPVSLVVTDYLRAVNAGGNAYTDTKGDAWVADQKWTAGGWGYYQKGSTNTTNHAITGTSDQTLYKSQRVDPYAYRFDNVPNGVYEVDVRFAEITKLKKTRRVFDVVIEDTMVLPAHDVDYDVGTYAADDNVFFVPVTDQRLDVRFIARAGFEKPMVNALRVRRRPDR